MASFAEWVEEEKKKKKKERLTAAEQYAAGMTFSDYAKKVLGRDDFDEPISTTKKDDDIAPVVTTTEEADEQKWYEGWFKKGDDDVAKTIVGTGTDAGTDFLTGLIGIGEKVWDGLLWLGATMNQGTMNEAAQNEMIYNAVTGKETDGVLEKYQSYQDQVVKETDEIIAKDLYDEEEVAKRIVSNLGSAAYQYNKSQSGGFMTQQDWEYVKQMQADSYEYINTEMEDDSVLDDKSDSLVQSGGQLAGTAALQAVGVPWWVTTGATTFGAETESALKQGATHEEAGLSAAISAGAEILTEKISGGISFGGNTLDDALMKEIGRAFSSKTARVLIKMGVDATGEGFEEVLSGALSAVGQKLSYASEKELSELFTIEDAAEAFIGGAVLGGGSTVTNAINSKVNGVDAVTGFTDNEQKVVDKEYESRIAEAEKDGKITEREKRKIYDRVLNDFDKGYISTDTIEEVLGGDTYTTYKDTIDSEDAQIKELQDQIKELEAAQNTVGNAKKYDALTAQLEELKNNSQRDQLKSQLSDEVFNLAKDSRLVESYNERARRGQAYEADISKYDAKQQAVIQKAIDSGILNNTNRTHEFVDMIAKISADKGVLFDFTDNDKLKNSGFAINGAQVNGYVTKDGVTLNIDSAKSLNSVVGHEITHVLEGTELYTELQSALFEYAKSKKDYKGRRDALAALYKNVKDADIDAELTADLVGDYLFTDSDFISRLSTEHRNVFQKIYDEVKYLLKVATAGSAEARELEKVKRAFEDAYRTDSKAQKNTATEGGVVYSLGQNIVDQNGTKYDNVVKLEYDTFNKVRRSGKAYIDFVRNNLIKQKTTVYDAEGNPEVVEFAGEKERVKKDGAKNSHPVIGELTQAKNKLKKLVILNATETAEISNFAKHKDEHSHQWLDENGWDERTSYVMTKDGTIYPVTLHIAKTRDGRNILYDVNVKTKEGVAVDENATSLLAEQLTRQAVKTTKPSSEDIKAQKAENVKRQYSLTDSNITDVSTGYASGETYYTMAYKQDGKVVATLQYGEYDGAPNVKMIEVEPEYRRKGIGTKLLQSLQQKYPDAEIDFGMATPDGVKLLDSITYDVTDEKVVADRQKLKDLQSELNELQEKLDILYDTENLTEAQEGEMHKLGDRWEEVYDSIRELEQTLRGKKATKTFVRFSLSAEADKSYLEAANRGDVATAQKMVDEAAKDAGYAIKAYHGTQAGDFTVFDKDRVGKGNDQYGAGFYFTTDKTGASHYGDRVINAALNIKNPIRITATAESGRNLIDADITLTSKQAYEVVKRHPDIYDEENSPLGDYFDSYWERGAQEWMVEDLAEQYREVGYLDSDLFRNHPNELHEALRDVTGYDGIEVTFERTGEKFYVAWFDNQMKSTDPVTYDDSGNIIPLSERFNAEKPDIRYSLSADGETPKTYGNYNVRGEDVKLETAQEVAPVQETTTEKVAPVQAPVTEPKDEADELISAIMDAEFRLQGYEPDAEAIAPTTETEAWLQAKRNLLAIEDKDIPTETEAQNDDLPDTTAIDKKALKGVAQSLKDVLALDNKEVKAIQDIVQEYSTTEFPDKVELAEKIKEQYGERVWVEKNEELAEVKRGIRKEKINVSDTVKKDIPDFAQYMRSNFGKVRFSKEGIPVDTAYMELAEMYGEYFPAEIENESDQLQRIVEVANMEVNTENVYELTDEEISQAVDIITAEVGKYKESQVEQMAEAERKAAFKHLDDVAPVMKSGTSSLVEIASNGRRDNLKGAYTQDGKQYIADGSFIAEFNTVDKNLATAKDFPAKKVLAELNEADSRQTEGNYSIDGDAVAALNNGTRNFIKVGDSLFDAKYVDAIISAIDNPVFTMSNVHGGDNALFVTGSNGRAVLMPVRAGDNVKVSYEAQPITDSMTVEDFMPIAEDIAPVAEKYEAIKPKPKPKEPRLVRADNAKPQTTAKVLTDEPKVDKKRRSLWSMAKEYVFDNGMVFEDIAKKNKNRELEAKWNYIRYAENNAQHFMKEGADGVKSLDTIREQVEKSGKTEKFYEYLYHSLNVDRMTLAERYESTPNKPVFGDAVTADMSRQTVAELEKANPEFKRYANDVYAYMGHLRSMMVENGVISQETADLWAEMYPHFVPIRRVGDTGLNINVPLDTGRTGVNAPIKRATGGSRDILPLFDTMGQRTIQTFKAVAKNSFGVELKNTLGTAIESDTASVDDVIDGIDTHEELLQEGKNGQKPTFTVFENGEKVTFEITDEMYAAMKPTGDALGYTNKVLNKVNDIRRGLLTEYNPTFLLTNAIKDVQDVLINSQHPAKTYARIPQAISELTTQGKWYAEYMANGGEQNSYFDNDTNTFEEENATLEALKKWTGIGAISKANNFIERIPRLAEYIASREAGASVEVAMLDAARVTTNFAAGGKLTKMLNRNGFTFLNASMQGAVQQVRNIREAKMNGLRGWAGLAAKFAVAGLASSLLNHLLWEDDEEYEELSDYVKDNYYIVAKYGDGQFVRIPKGRAVAVIQSAFEQMENAITGDDEVDLGRFTELVVTNLAPNNPLDNNLLAPVIQAATNKTWYGDDLVPTRLQDVPAAEQYDETTDSISKWLGEKTGTSPYKWNYLLDQYSGGVGDMILPMLTPAAERGDTTGAGNLLAPFKDKFTTDSVLKNQNVSDFYDKVDELTVNANASGATDEDVLKSKYINSISAEMGDLYKRKREIQNSDLPDDEKYNAVRELQQQIVDRAKEALNAYENVTINGEYAYVGDREYRWYEPSEGSDAEAGWQKISDKQAEKQDNVTSALGISKAEYWRNKEEYDYAYEYPEKYAVAKVVGGYTAYKGYSSELYDIKADKDEDGKSISGSRKDKVIEYINNLDADYGEKIILFKSEYNADDTYNYEIIEYLNSRDDISYDEMATILKELGFTVTADGSIYW